MGNILNKVMTKKREYIYFMFITFFFWQSGFT